MQYITNENENKNENNNKKKNKVISNSSMFICHDQFVQHKTIFLTSSRHFDLVFFDQIQYEQTKPQKIFYERCEFVLV